MRVFRSLWVAALLLAAPSMVMAQGVSGGASKARAVQLYDFTTTAGGVLNTPVLDASPYREMQMVFTTSAAGFAPTIFGIRDDGSEWGLMGWTINAPGDWNVPFGPGVAIGNTVISMVVPKRFKVYAAAVPGHTIRVTIHAR